ncbi:MAG: hypothetical protein KY469_09190 [Actinobacteria bacterium]|nr:hypothetical protein [Actinomycetota bacterium]
MASAIAALSVVPFALSAEAPAATVQVEDNAYTPEVVEVATGQTVEWIWTGTGDHSVTFEDGEDSHPGCGITNREACGGTGDTYERAFSKSGDFRYWCRVHVSTYDMRGTVRVTGAQPSPSPTSPDLPTESETTETPSPTPTPSRTPAPTPSTEPTEEPTTEPTEEPTEDPSTEPPSEPPFVHEPPPPPPPPPPPRQLPLGPEPDPSPTDGVSPSEIEFEPFPEPGEGSDDPAGDEVAVAFPGGGDPDRPVLLVVATLAVVGSATTFGALVLFGPPWMGG